MFELALKEMRLDKLRTLLTAVAVGAVIAVILILEGFEQGQYYQLRKIIENRGADLFIAESGVENFVAVRSSLPQQSRQEVESIEGVKSAHPLTAVPIIYTKDGMRTPVYVLVYDQLGGPSSIIEGDHIKNGGEIVIDQALAVKYGLSPGDSFYVTDFQFKISGITNEAAFMMPFAFIDYDGMLDLFLESEIAPDLSTFPLLSYLLVEVEDTKDSELVAMNIDALVDDVDAIPAKTLSQNDIAMGKTFFKPIMGLLVSIGYLIGMLVVALVLHSDVNSRIKSFAVLKALGFRPSYLSRAVFFQACILLTISVPIGVFFAFSIAQVIHSISPVYFVHIFEPRAFTQTIVACFGFSLIGAFIPLRSIFTSDPLTAFQGS